MWCARRKDKKTTSPPSGRRRITREKKFCLSNPEFSLRKTRGLRRIVSPRMKLKRGQPKLLSPNRSLSQNAADEARKGGRETRDPLRPPGACESVCACYPELPLFLPCQEEKRKREKKRERRNKFPTLKRNAPKCPEHPYTTWDGGRRVVGGVVASSSS